MPDGASCRTITLTQPCVSFPEGEEGTRFGYVQATVAANILALVLRATARPARVRTIRFMIYLQKRRRESRRAVLMGIY
jgi:hypothetical protein